MQINQNKKIPKLRYMPCKCAVHKVCSSTQPHLSALHGAALLLHWSHFGIGFSTFQSITFSPFQNWCAPIILRPGALKNAWNQRRQDFQVSLICVYYSLTVSKDVSQLSACNIPASSFNIYYTCYPHTRTYRSTNPKACYEQFIWNHLNGGRWSATKLPLAHCVQ